MGANMIDHPQYRRVSLAVSFLAIFVFVSGCSTHRQESAKASAGAPTVKTASIKKKPVKTAKAEPAKSETLRKAADDVITASIAPEAAPIIGRTWNYEYDFLFLFAAALEAIHACRFTPESPFTSFTDWL
jgi:hypothetical protein